MSSAEVYSAKESELSLLSSLWQLQTCNVDSGTSEVIDFSIDPGTNSDGISGSLPLAMLCQCLPTNITVRTTTSTIC